MATEGDGAKSAVGRTEKKVKTMGKGQENKGFALVEVLIASVLFGLFFVTAILYYRTAIDLWKYGNQKTEVQQQARIALERLVTDLQQAAIVEVRADGKSAWQEITSGLITELTGQTRIKIVIPQKDEDVPVTVYYYRQGDTLIRSTGGHNPIALNITKVELVCREACLCQIRLTACINNDVETELETTAYMRNLS
ncbi:MAG: PilW family protein [bacterium]